MHPLDAEVKGIVDEPSGGLSQTLRKFTLQTGRQDTPQDLTEGKGSNHYQTQQLQ